MDIEHVSQGIPVLLLKTRSIPNDSYEEYFSSSIFEPDFIPVLEHKSNGENLETVRALLQNGELVGPRRKYGGLIFTSQRAVEAFAKVVEEIEGLPATAPFSHQGSTTSRTLSTLLSGSPLLQSYGSSIFGADTGNGENLAKYILGHYNSLYQSQGTDAEQLPKPPLLFLVGEQRRDIIPKTLTSSSLPATERIGVDELVVYETGVMESFPQDLESKLATCKQRGPRGNIITIVVFSPSGCDAMLKCLGYIDSSGKLTKEGEKGTRWPGQIQKSRSGPGQIFCIASIGPTTRDYLYNNRGFEVDVCAEKPSPEGVGEGIESFLKALGLMTTQDSNEYRGIVV